MRQTVRQTVESPECKRDRQTDRQRKIFLIISISIAERQADRQRQILKYNLEELLIHEHIYCRTPVPVNF